MSQPKLRFVWKNFAWILINYIIFVGVKVWIFVNYQKLLPEYATVIMVVAAYMMFPVWEEVRDE